MDQIKYAINPTQHKIMSDTEVDNQLEAKSSILYLLVCFMILRFVILYTMTFTF
jgi:hypothetical protein